MANFFMDKIYFFVVLTVLQRKAFRTITKDGSAKPVNNIFRYPEVSYAKKGLNLFLKVSVPVLSISSGEDSQTLADQQTETGCVKGASGHDILQGLFLKGCSVNGNASGRPSLKNVLIMPTGRCTTRTNFGIFFSPERRWTKGLR